MQRDGQKESVSKGEGSGFGSWVRCAGPLNSVDPLFFTGLGYNSVIGARALPGFPVNNIP